MEIRLITVIKAINVILAIILIVYAILIFVTLGGFSLSNILMAIYYV